MSSSAKSLAVGSAVVCLAWWAVASGQAEPTMMPTLDSITLLFRVLFTVLVAGIVPVYFVKYGPTNFLWFSDIGLFGVCAALWLESSLLGSMMALAMLLPEIVWVVSFVTGLLWKGRSATTLASYMFDAKIPLWLRGLSLFHLALPPGVLWLVYHYGYDERALAAQTLLAWVVLPVTLWLTPPDKNINWVRGFGHPPRSPVSPPIHFVLIMLMYPLLLYVPTHFLLRGLFGR